MNKFTLPAAAAVLALAACSSASTAHTAATASASPSAPSPAAIAAALGCQLSGAATDPQDAYDTAAYDSLSAAANPASPCTVGSGVAESVITFASESRETDWLHQNDQANSGEFAQGYVGLVAGPLWVVPDGSGVSGLSAMASALARFHGREVTSP